MAAVYAVLVFALLIREQPLRGQPPAASELLTAAEQAQDESPERAYELASRALSVSRRASDARMTSRALEVLIEASTDLGRHDEAVELARARLALVQESGDRRGEVTARLDLGAIAMDRTRYGDAQAHFEEALDMVEELDDLALTAKVYAELGGALRQRTRYPEALDCYRRSRAISEQLGDRSEIGGRWSNIGVVLELMGDFEGSLAAHERSLEIERELGDEGGVATSLYNVGEVHRELGDFESALENFRFALHIDERLGNRSYIAHSHNQIGLTLLDLDELDEAREHTLTAEEIFAELAAPRNVAWARSSRGRIELAAGDLETAERLFEESLPGARESVSLTAGIWRDMADVSLRLGDLDEAQRRAAAALQAADESWEKDKEAEIHSLLARIHEARGDSASALASVRAELQLRKEIFDAQRAGTIASMQSRLDNVRNEQEVDRLERDRALREAEIERQALVRRGWLAGVLAVSVVAFLVFGRVSQRRLNRKLATQVAERTRELQSKHEELEDAYRELEEVSVTDSLTGLHNRRYLQQYIGSDIAKSLRDLRRGDRGTGIVDTDHVFFLIDVDHFKEVNDRYGHAAGDAVLVELAERLRGVFRAADFLVRWGGDEFLAVARFTDRNEAPGVAQRVREALAERPFEAGEEGAAIGQTCSIGFACFPFDREAPEAMGWETVVEVADACLRLVKRSSRDAWVGVLHPGESVECQEGELSNLASSSISSGRWPVVASAPIGPGPDPGEGTSTADRVRAG